MNTYINPSAIQDGSINIDKLSEELKETIANSSSWSELIDTRIKNIITMSYSEEGPDEYRVSFNSNYPVAGEIRICDTNGHCASILPNESQAIIAMYPSVPNILDFNAEPIKDDTYRYILQ